MLLVFNKIISRMKSYLRRHQSKKTAYLYSPTNEGWRKFQAPVLGEGDNIYFDPFVRKVKNEYFMVVSYRNNNSLRMLRSSNGVQWKDPIEILRGIDGSWDGRVNRACCLNLNDKTYLWYTGQNNGKSSIGLAISKDGVSFERFSEEAILVADQAYEGISVMNPCVLWDETEGLFKMWYAAGDNYEPDVICYATSFDGIKWKKYKNNPVIEKGEEVYDRAKVGGCDVIKHDMLYHMFYIGYENIDNARICHAISKDGITWERSKDNPILSASKDKWDRHAVYKPTVCADKDKWMLWYNGRNSRREYIGLAFKVIQYRN